MPALIVAVFFRARWWQSYLLLLAGLLIDVDHLLATPVYDPLRCSIGFHPLHRWPFAAIYLLMLLHHRTRLIATGLILHLLLDAADCMQMTEGMQQLRGFLQVP